MSQPFLRRALTAALLALLLAGCGARVKPVNTEFAERNWQIRLSILAAVQSFELKGRLAESGLSATRGDLAWAQSGERFDVRVSGPLGVGALAISGDPRTVEIRTKDGVFVTDSPESFMQQRLGWSLPLPQLRYWVLGLPAPLRATLDSKLILDDAGRAQIIKQAGWDIEYTEYQTVGALALPRKLSLANGDRSFRIVIDSWSGTP
ncbi:MAG: lipoprotein insertase outer membrane protein LolB [Nevskia sp.]